MKYIPLTSALLALLLMLTVNAYATTADTGPTAEDIPEWALRPALEPDEEPAADTTDTTETETKPEYTMYVVRSPGEYIPRSESGIYSNYG